MLLIRKEQGLVLGSECSQTLPTATTVTVELLLDKGEEKQWDALKQWQI